MKSFHHKFSYSSLEVFEVTEITLREFKRCISRCGNNNNPNIFLDLKMTKYDEMCNLYEYNKTGNKQ